MGLFVAGPNFTPAQILRRAHLRRPLLPFYPAVSGVNEEKLLD